LFLSVGLYKIASIATIPGKDDYAASLFISKIPIYGEVKNTHMYVLLG
jgi:hypothetical protein